MKKLTVLLLFCLFLIASCGYQFEGGGYINSNITHVNVTVFENKSSETGAGITFTNALVREIIEETYTKIADHKEIAAAILKGTINSITFDTLSRATTESVIERRVTVNVDLQLMNEKGQIVWSVNNYTTYEEYKVSEDKITDESNKRDAVDRISVRMAEKLVSNMLNDF